MYARAFKLEKVVGTPRLLSGVISGYPVVHPPACEYLSPREYPRPGFRVNKQPNRTDSVTVSVLLLFLLLFLLLSCLPVPLLLFSLPRILTRVTALFSSVRSGVVIWCIWSGNCQCNPHGAVINTLQLAKKPPTAPLYGLLLPPSPSPFSPFSSSSFSLLLLPLSPSPLPGGRRAARF